MIILSQCHRGKSLDTFFEGIRSDPIKLAVVGCGCSVATEPVAEISHTWNISQVYVLCLLKFMKVASLFGTEICADILFINFPIVK